MKILEINNVSRNLKMKCFKMPNAPYSNRYLHGEERETVEYKLKLELKHIIEKITDWKGFVFANTQTTHLAMQPQRLSHQLLKELFCPPKIIFYNNSH